MGITVLSLFDGISCGMVALERAGIEVDKYIAYEIEHNAIEISKKNYPEIVRGGDVTKEDFTKYKGKIDILIGGSPCQNLCSCGNRKGLEGEESRLFFDYVRALYETEAKWFLLENNATMTKENQDIITGIMGVEPIYINSNLLTAQERKRLYWTNIPDIKQPEDKGIFLRDIVQPREEKKECEPVTDEQVAAQMQQAEPLVIETPEAAAEGSIRVYDYDGCCIYAYYGKIRINNDGKDGKDIDVEAIGYLEGYQEHKEESGAGE